MQLTFKGLGLILPFFIVLCNAFVNFLPAKGLAISLTIFTSSLYEELSPSAAVDSFISSVVEFIISNKMSRFAINL